MRLRIFLAYAVCCLGWGSTWVVIKLGLEDLPPLRFAGLRMALSFALLTPLAARRLGAGVPPGRWRDIGLVGAVQIGGTYTLVFLAAKWIPSSVSAVLFATFPIWASLLAHVLLENEPMTWGAAASGAFGLIGVAVLQGEALWSLSFSSKVALGSALALLTPLCSALGNVWMKRQVADVSPVLNLWGQSLVGGALLLLASFAFERGAEAQWTPRAVLALGYLALVGTVIAFLALFWLMPRIPVSAVGAIPLIDTAIAVALGGVVLGEPLGWRFLGGAALILVGAMLANGLVPRPPAARGEQARPA
jgi:drug/metabolite transporter (DMT)-like permease